MTEEEFVEILSRGHLAPPAWHQLSAEYQKYYAGNPWQIPNTEWGREISKYLKTLDK